YGAVQLASALRIVRVTRRLSRIIGVVVEGGLTPLLEEEWHAGIVAPSVDIFNPFPHDRAGTAPRLAPHNDPVEPRQIEGLYRADQGFARQEAALGAGRSEVIHAKGYGLALNRHTHPNILGPG